MPGKGFGWRKITKSATVWHRFEWGATGDFWRQKSAVNHGFLPDLPPKCPNLHASLLTMMTGPLECWSEDGKKATYFLNI